MAAAGGRLLSASPGLIHPPPRDWVLHHPAGCRHAGHGSSTAAGFGGSCPRAWWHCHGPAEGTAVELPQPRPSLLGDAARS